MLLDSQVLQHPKHWQMYCSPPPSQMKVNRGTQKSAMAKHPCAELQTGIWAPASLYIQLSPKPRSPRRETHF